MNIFLDTNNTLTFAPPKNKGYYIETEGTVGNSVQIDYNFYSTINEAQYWCNWNELCIGIYSTISKSTGESSYTQILKTGGTNIEVNKGDYIYTPKEAELVLSFNLNDIPLNITNSTIPQKAPHLPYDPSRTINVDSLLLPTTIDEEPIVNIGGQNNVIYASLLNNICPDFGDDISNYIKNSIGSGQGYDGADIIRNENNELIFNCYYASERFMDKNVANKVNSTLLNTIKPNINVFDQFIPQFCQISDGELCQYYDPNTKTSFCTQFFPQNSINQTGWTKYSQCKKLSNDPNFLYLFNTLCFNNNSPIDCGCLNPAINSINFLPSNIKSIDELNTYLAPQFWFKPCQSTDFIYGGAIDNTLIPKNSQSFVVKALTNAGISQENISKYVSFITPPNIEEIHTKMGVYFQNLNNKETIQNNWLSTQSHWIIVPIIILIIVILIFIVLIFYVKSDFGIKLKNKKFI